MKKYAILFLFFAVAGIVFAGKPSDYVSFEKEGRNVDHFLGRTWTKITWSFQESSRFFKRFRAKTETKAKNLRDKAGKEVRSKVKELDHATDHAEEYLTEKARKTTDRFRKDK